MNGNTDIRRPALLLIACLMPHLSPAGDPSAPVATVTRTIRQVDRQSAGAAWQDAHKGDRLQAGDLVRTGEASLAIVKFLDNSLIQIRGSSTIAVTGELRNRSLSKEVRLNNGAVGFTIPKQRPGEEFRFTSPTSVASVRGTSGYFASSDSSDTLTVLEGSIRFSSLLSNEEVDVAAGYTAVTGGDGNVAQAPSTDAQRLAAEGALKSGDMKKQLEIEFRNGSGKSKKLKIEYRE